MYVQLRKEEDEEDSADYIRNTKQRTGLPEQKDFPTQTPQSSSSIKQVVPNQQGNLLSPKTDSMTMFTTEISNQGTSRINDISTSTGSATSISYDTYVFPWGDLKCWALCPC